MATKRFPNKRSSKAKISKKNRNNYTMVEANVLRNVAPLLLITVAFLCCSIGNTSAQENIMPQIPPSLEECYNTSYFMNRQNRLPATIDTLISLIEKVENTATYVHDIRTLSVALLQRFRQDGIQRAYGVAESPGVIPYSPTGFQFPKFRILLSRLIPGNAFTFPNSTLTREERCSLHFMLSSSIDMRVRGDEGSVCSRLSQYRSQRLRRSANNLQRNNELIGDVEMLESWNAKAQKRGLKQKGAYSDYDWGWTNTGSSNNNQVSQCPVENGVIWTPWGTVSAGALLAGVATGLQQQSVQLRTLLALSSRNNGYTNLPQTATVSVDNRWAATLAGDLAEVALVQVPFTTTETASVGANGAWNSTVMPKWYFLMQRQNFEMTDAEIRGGLDGLIIAMNIASWRSQASSMKLSQLLRMYYSTNGVLNSGIMACNRKSYFNNLVQNDQTMVAQTSAFAQVLDREMQLGVTLSATSIAQFAQSAASALETYVPWLIPDCYAEDEPQGIHNLTSIMTDVFVFLDTTWPYYFVADYVNFVLQRLNINPFASSVTLLSAADATIMVNTTHYMSEVYENWNITTHSWYKPGFSLPQILNTAAELAQNVMSNDRNTSSLGGQSLVALLIPSPIAYVADWDMRYALHFLEHLNYTVPDLHFLYYGGGALIRFENLVPNPHKDLFPLGEEYGVWTAGTPVVRRIREIPRRLVNPRCGADMYATAAGPNEMAQYVRAGAINFYRIMPNYFFGSTSLRYLRITPVSAASFIVCSSRTIPLPYRKDSADQTEQGCGQTAATNGYSLDLSELCVGYTRIEECPPLYISVQAQQFIGGSELSCTNAACESPNELQFLVYVRGLVCNAAAKFSATLTMILTLVLALVQISFIRFSNYNHSHFKIQK
ncbi:uncharacterized protein LOC101457811 isoform X2 [Ceratitis capitata]|uniref:uncharacterized protein LOC101457811 isoform X2 n=1 Tax=Ceratitis capitata TaxID=7213 RepID=UPI000A0FFA1F|nr:uncharacterized protein LOC101457811 isoform X2 [Ceratitis capitata]